MLQDFSVRLRRDQFVSLTQGYPPIEWQYRVIMSTFFISGINLKKRPGQKHRMQSKMLL
jgi:hypothetical protein